MKYRIKEVHDKDVGSLYYPQYRLFGIWFYLQEHCWAGSSRAWFASKDSAQNAMKMYLAEKNTKPIYHNVT